MRTRSIAPGAARWPQEICAPFEGRAGRRGAGEQPLAIAEHDFGVGSDIDEKREFVPEIRPLGEHDAGRVGADMAGDAGQRIDERARRDVEPQLARPRFVSAVDRKRERRAAEFGRIEAENEMMHDRIADQGRFEDFAARDARLARRLADQRVHRLAHRPRQFLVAARVHHDVGDAAHQIFAEPDLRVHRPAAATTSPLMRSDRCAAMVVEPMSIATP